MRIISILQLLSILTFPLCSYAQPGKENQSVTGENRLPKGRVTRGYVSAEQLRDDSQRVIKLPEKLTPIPERKIVPTH